MQRTCLVRGSGIEPIHQGVFQGRPAVGNVDVPSFAMCDKSIDCYEWSRTAVHQTVHFIFISGLVSPKIVHGENHSSTLFHTSHWPGTSSHFPIARPWRIRPSASSRDRNATRSPSRTRTCFSFRDKTVPLRLPRAEASSRSAPAATRCKNRERRGAERKRSQNPR